MPANPQILQLLETLMDSGGSPEEVCTDFPELLEPLKEQWEQCRRIDAHIDALFGSSEDPDGESGDSETPDTDLPRIPGYHVITIEGHGGIGIVYRARHLELNRIIALKMLLSGAFAGRVERTRFLREARAVASLRHNNIVQVYDAGEFEGRPFFTMEMVEGKTLAEFLQGNPQPSAATTAMLLKLADATEYAHQNRIIHRDLKPANVLLTIDGTPKISDFGLARRLEGEAGLTVSGTRLGTPSYMAPEQALGKETVGPEADVYSLGAILYEMLTGRPPFRGESVADTERQLLAEDPVPPSKLNARVPRDLETICLKCLRKEPARRYPSAAELGKDLARFQHGEPVLARKAGMFERSTKWVRRHPAIATALCGTTLVALLLLSAAVWWFSQRDATLRAVNDDLNNAIRFQQQSNWASADAALDRATFLLGNRGSADLRQRLDGARRDSTLVARLNEIHFATCRGATGDGDFNQTDKDYEAAFKEAGIGTDADPPATIADRINQSVVHDALLDALDDWALCLNNQRCVWIIHVARLADPDRNDPTSWRTQFRDTRPAVWFDRTRINRLVAMADVQHTSVSLLLGLTSRYVHAGRDPIPFLKKIQEAHPSDFWVNLELANQLAEIRKLPEAIRYYQAALALRPDAALVHHNLGKALYASDLFDDGVTEMKEACRLNPTDAIFHGILGSVLWRHKRFEDAIPYLLVAVRCDPDDAISHFNLGDCFARDGRDADAARQFRMAIGLKPEISKAESELRTTLIKNERPELLQLAWQWAMKTDPPGYEPREGYAELCLLADNKDQYTKECHRLLQTFGDSKDSAICTSVGEACLLAPESGDDLARAVALVDRAVAADVNSNDPRTRFAHGLAEYRQGHFAEAIAILQGDFPPSLRSSPNLVLVMAQFRQGQIETAQKTLTAAIHGFDWTPAKASTREHWIAQVLRREAEQLIKSR